MARADHVHVGAGQVGAEKRTHSNHLDMALLEPALDAVEIGDELVTRYEELWDALTSSERFSADERWRVSARIERLNQLGFDVDRRKIDMPKTVKEVGEYDIAYRAHPEVTIPMKLVVHAQK